MNENQKVAATTGGAIGISALASFIEFDDYRDVDGFRLAHMVRYFDKDQLLATDSFQHIAIHQTRE